MTRIAVALSTVMYLAFAAGDAFAQSGRVGRCSLESQKASFATTAANRLNAQAIQDRVIGKRTRLMRRQFERPIVFRITNIFRTDGSLSTQCEWQTQAGGYAPCTGTTDRGGARDVGTWRLDRSGSLCVARTSGVRGQDEACLSVHHDGGRYAMVLLSGEVACVAGDFEILP